MKSKNTSAISQLMKFILGKWISKPIYAVSELGIADILSDGPESIDQLAVKTNANAPALYRIMRALASVGIFSEQENGTFENTAMSELLKSDVMRCMPLMFHSVWNDVAWMHLVDCIKTGDTAFETAYGVQLADWLQNNPKAAHIFNEANAAKAVGTHQAIIEAYDFSKVKKVTDIGGGNGALMLELLSANPHMKGVVLDLPNVIKSAKEMIHNRNIQDRCQPKACDFFKDPIPSGSDAYMLSNILHDWSDDNCRMILSNCREAMKPGSKLLIIEMIIPEGNKPSISKLLDLEMLVMTGGKERTEEEFGKLLESARFTEMKIYETADEVSLIEVTIK